MILTVVNIFSMFFFSTTFLFPLLPQQHFSRRIFHPRAFLFYLETFLSKIQKSSETSYLFQSFHSISSQHCVIDGDTIRHFRFHLRFSSFILTIQSVLELHQIMRYALADFTAGRELHPALKISLFCCHLSSVLHYRSRRAVCQSIIFLIHIWQYYPLQRSEASTACSHCF